jgi:hypothetical protein
VQLFCWWKAFMIITGIFIYYACNRYGKVEWGLQICWTVDHHLE